MTQYHFSQEGVFHIISTTKNRTTWCTEIGVPEILMDNLIMTRNAHRACLFAFCILPNHINLLISPGQKGLSAFMHSFKRNRSRDVRQLLNPMRAKVHEHPLREIHWQKGFYDRHIRTDDQLSSTLFYIQTNALHHQLVSTESDWPWSSIHFSRLLDPMDF